MMKATMKLFRKTFIVLLMTFSILFCTFISACKDGNAFVGKWDTSGQFFSGLPDNLGVPIIYERENAEIEMSNMSAEVQIWVTEYVKGKGNKILIGTTESISHTDCPYKYKGNVIFQWLPNAVLQDLEDYIVFKAKIDNEIIGYAVIHVWANGKTGNGKVLVDRECKSTSEESVNEKIQEVINIHKSSQ